MKWFRKTFLWASLGCLGATSSAWGQANGRPALTPLANDPAEIRVASHGVSLGKPTPIAPEANRVVNAFVPFELSAIPQVTTAQFPLPTVVRGMRPIAEDEPGKLVVPKDLPPLIDKSVGPVQPVQASQPAAKDKVKKIENGSPPVITSPRLESTDRIVVLENGSMVDDQGRSLFGLGHGGNRQFYGSAEWLFWGTRGFHLPPLVITASPDTPIATRGILGVDPTTRILYGDQNVTGGMRSGARFTLGYTPDPCGYSIEGSFFFLSRRNDNEAFGSSQFPVLGRPFFDLNDNVPSRELTASPDQGPNSIFAGTGSIRVDASSTLLGADATLRPLLCSGCNYQIHGSLGFRYLNLSDHLSITENTLVLQAFPLAAPDVPVLVGDQVTIFDRFNTRNNFYGAQIGLATEWQRDRWIIEGKVKLGLGITRQSVDIDGGQRIVSPDGKSQSFVGGLYAVPSNIGHHTQSQFGVVPEIGVKAGYQLTENVRLFVGYDFLYWNSVLRPGDQIDQVIDLNQVPQSGRPFPPASQLRPVVPFRTTSYWAMGLNAGLEFRY